MKLKRMGIILPIVLIILFVLAAFYNFNNNYTVGGDGNEVAISQGQALPYKDLKDSIGIHGGGNK